MKTNFKFLAALAILAVGFTACNKDDDNGPDGGGETGEQTTLTIQFKDASTQTKAPGDPVGSLPAEKAVQKVDIFLFNPSSGRLVDHKELLASSDSLNQNGDTWVAQVRTESGNRNIFVAINLPSDFAQKIETENNVSAVQLIANGANDFDSQIVGNPNRIYDGTGLGFAMFSTEVKNETLEPGQPNTVPVEVERLVAKVSPKNVVTKFDDISDANFVEDLTFAIGQRNKKTFAFQTRNSNGYVIDPNYTGWKIDYQPTEFYNEFGTDAAINENAYMAIPKTNYDYTTSHSKYAPENTSSNNIRGELTFVSVRARFYPVYLSEWDDTDNEIKETPSGFTNWQGTGKNYYVLCLAQADGKNKYYYFESAVKAQEAIDKLFASTPAADRPTAPEYKDGQCYYSVLLNYAASGSASLKSYDVLRNELYHVSISAINQLGHPGPEITDPDKPAAEETDLTVEITIQDWVWVEQNNELDK